MNSLRNRVQLIGRVGQEPEVANLENGKKFVKFSMATNEVYTNSNGDKVTTTDWHYVTFWNKLADVIEKFVHKGNEIAVEGKLSSRSWEDENGIRHYATTVEGHNVVLLGKKAEAPVEQ